MNHFSEILKPLRQLISLIDRNEESISKSYANFRVADDDVEGLAQLMNVVSLELVYHVGSVQTPGLGTQRFLQGIRHVILSRKGGKGDRPGHQVQNYL